MLKKHAFFYHFYCNTQASNPSLAQFPYDDAAQPKSSTPKKVLVNLASPFEHLQLIESRMVTLEAKMCIGVTSTLKNSS